MIYKEYGVANAETIILLHGGGLSWWNYREVANLLQSDYHLILPILDGHAGSDKPFTSIEDNASEIIEYIDKNLSGKILFIGGLSLGAQVVLDILSQRNNICRHALIESAAVFPSKLTNALIRPIFGSCYRLMKNKSFAKQQFKFLRINPDLFEEYYRDTCKISKSDMIAFMKANTAYFIKESLRGCSTEVHIFAGEKENRKILSSAKEINKIIPNAKLTILPGLYHGEFSINNARDYVNKVKSILKNK